MKRFYLFIVCIAFITQALMISFGHYTLSALAFCSMAGLLLLVAAPLTQSDPRISNSSLQRKPIFFLFLVGIYFSRSLALNPRLTHAISSAPALAVLQCLLWVSLAAGVAGLALFALRREKRATQLLILAFVAAAATKLLVINVSPDPQIDVVTVGMEAMERLKSGVNPYREAYPDIYAGLYGYTPRLTYLPGYVLLIFPVHLLFGDIRWASVLADLAFLGIAIRLVRHPLKHWLTAWVWATFPLSLFIIDKGWVDALMLPCAALAFLALSKDRWKTAGICLGMLASIKQYAPAVPFFALLWTWKHRGPPQARTLLLWTAMTLCAVLLPWLLWDARALYASTVAYLAAVPPRKDALSWFAHFLRRGLPLSSIAVALGALAGMIAGIRLSLSRAQGSWLAGSAALYLGLFLFAKQAFCNYYAWACGLLWLAVIAKLNSHESGTSQKTF